MNYSTAELDQTDEDFFVKGPLPDSCAATKSGQCRDCGSGIQLIKQRLRLLQIERVEPFGKPAVNRSEKLASLIPFPLVAPEPAEAGSGAEFKDPRALPPSDAERLMIAVLGRDLIACSIQQIATHAM